MQQFYTEMQTTLLLTARVRKTWFSPQIPILGFGCYPTEAGYAIQRRQVMPSSELECLLMAVMSLTVTAPVSKQAPRSEKGLCWLMPVKP